LPVVIFHDKASVQFLDIGDENGGGCGYESGTRRRARPGQAAKGQAFAFRGNCRLIEIALAGKSKRQSNRGEK
jgi:hypothetical protein